MAYLTHFNSMDVALDKGICIPFQTKRISGYWEETLDDIYVRGPKKGQNKIKKHPIYEFVYNTLSDTWSTASDFKQVSAGRTHYIREVVICDYDRPKDINGNVIPGTPTFLEMIPKWTEICEKNNIPLPNYWVENPLTKNGQFGWFINITSKNDKAYMETVHKVNAVFGCDMNFTGWQCKNPFYDGLNTIWNDKDSIIDLSILSNINTLSYSSYYHNTKVTPLNIKEKTRILSKKGRKTMSNKEGYTTSRHIYLRKYLTEYIWKWMRTHNGIEPSQDKIEEWAFSIAKDAAEYTGKGEMQDSVEIKRNMQSISKWAVRMFRMPDSKKSVFTEESRNLSKLVRKCKKFIAYNEVMKMEGSTREVARQTGLSNKTVSEYRNMSSEEVEMLNLFAWSFIEYLENDKVVEVKDDYIDMYNTIKSILSYSSYYHNTKVTPSEISDTTNKYAENIGTLPYQTINDITYSAEDLNEMDRKLEFYINGKTLGLKEDGTKYGYVEQSVLDFNEWVAYTKWAV